ncbi:hypothetical protein EMCRGX_G017476 [Ephydatia muelleri]
MLMLRLRVSDNVTRVYKQRDDGWRFDIILVAAVTDDNPGTSLSLLHGNEVEQGKICVAVTRRSEVEVLTVQSHYRMTEDQNHNRSSDLTVPPPPAPIPTPMAVSRKTSGLVPDADVFVCALIGGQVTILDTYNIPNAYGYNNVMDSSQDLCPSSMNFVNGRIQCVFSRAIKTNDVLQDKALNQSYYQLSGWTDATGSSMAAIAYHSPTPKISSPITAGTTNVDSPIRAHGILMALVVMGMFFAAETFYA